MANPLLAGYTTVRRFAMLGIVHRVWFLSPKNADVDPLLELWNASKQVQRMKSLHVRSLVAERRIVGGTAVVKGVVLFPIFTIFSLVIGIRTSVRWLVERN